MQRSDGSEGYGDARDKKSASLGSENGGEEGKLLLGETAKLSLYFCVLWVSLYIYSLSRHRKRLYRQLIDDPQYLVRQGF